MGGGGGGGGARGGGGPNYRVQFKICQCRMSLSFIYYRDVVLVLSHVTIIDESLLCH